jgi:phosphatidylserine decarboxylase
MTIYLAPTDYHRIHCPFKGKIISSMHLGKSLYSVNKNAQETIPKLYIKNERSVLHINSAMMNYALVSVGASVVGSIVPFWNSKPEHSRHDLMEEWDIGPKEDESNVEIGDELAHFRMGSTVILIFEDSKKLDLDSLNENKRVKFGSKLISLKNL